MEKEMRVDEMESEYDSGKNTVRSIIEKKTE